MFLCLLVANLFLSCVSTPPRALCAFGIPHVPKDHLQGESKDSPCETVQPIRLKTSSQAGIKHPARLPLHIPHTPVRMPLSGVGATAPSIDKKRTRVLRRPTSDPQRFKSRYTAAPKSLKRLAGIVSRVCSLSRLIKWIEVRTPKVAQLLGFRRERRRAAIPTQRERLAQQEDLPGAAQRFRPLRPYPGMSPRFDTPRYLRRHLRRSLRAFASRLSPRRAGQSSGR